MSLPVHASEPAAPVDVRLHIFDLQANWHKIGRDSKESSRLWHVLREVEVRIARQAAAPAGEKS